MQGWDKHVPQQGASAPPGITLWISLIESFKSGTWCLSVEWFWQMTELEETSDVAGQAEGRGQPTMAMASEVFHPVRLGPSTSPG